MKIARIENFKGKEIFSLTSSSDIWKIMESIFLVKVYPKRQRLNMSVRQYDISIVSPISFSWMFLKMTSSVFVRKAIELRRPMRIAIEPEIVIYLILKWNNRILRKVIGYKWELQKKSNPEFFFFSHGRIDYTDSCIYIVGNNKYSDKLHNIWPVMDQYILVMRVFFLVDYLEAMYDDGEKDCKEYEQRYLTEFSKGLDTLHKRYWDVNSHDNDS